MTSWAAVSESDHTVYYLLHPSSLPTPLSAYLVRVLPIYDIHCSIADDLLLLYRVPPNLPRFSRRSPILRSTPRSQRHGHTRQTHRHTTFVCTYHEFRRTSLTRRVAFRPCPGTTSQLHTASLHCEGVRVIITRRTLHPSSYLDMITPGA